MRSAAERPAPAVRQRGLSLLQLLFLIGAAGIIAWLVLNYFAS